MRSSSLSKVAVWFISQVFSVCCYLIEEKTTFSQCHDPIFSVFKCEMMNQVFPCLQTSNSIGFGKETERSMTMSRSVIPDIPSSHESLIKWAYEHNYSPVTSYTKAPVANRFHLQLEDTGKPED